MAKALYGALFDWIVDKVGVSMLVVGVVFCLA